MKIYLLLILPLLLAMCSRPLARFEVESPEDEMKVPASVKFENESEKATEYFWDFGDGTTSTEEDPTHRYTRSGIYQVKLTASDGKKMRTAIQEIHLKSPDRCLVEIRTSMGNMLAVLFDSTPQHQDNFLKLARENYFDSLIFHRVISGFMIQGGDPESRNAPPGKALGSGGPGYKIPAEINDSLIHVKGAIAAARQGDMVNPEKMSSGSQFYIVQGRQLSKEELDMFEIRKDMKYSPGQREAYLEKGGTPFLDREYTVFGMVVKGLDVLDKIAEAKTDQRDRPLEDIFMTIELIR